METKFADATKTMNLPILKHFENTELITTDNPLKSFRKGEKGLFSILKLLIVLGIVAAIGVWVVPPLFKAIGQMSAAIASVVMAGAFIFSLPVIFKIVRRLTRKLHKLAIKHDPFGELYEQKGKMANNKRKFVISQGTINKLGNDTRIEASKAEELAKELQTKIVSSRKKIGKLKTRQDELKVDPKGKTSPEYIDNYAKLIKLGAAVQRDIAQKEQQQNFVRKYGVRANTIQKLSNKLVLVGAQLDIKILDFDATIDILKREFDYAQAARKATQTAKDALISTEGWEVTYAMDIVSTTIAQDIAMTSANISDINSYTSLYDMDDDELYTKLDAMADEIEAGTDVVPSAEAYNNPDYKMTNEDRNQAGDFGGMF